MIKFDNYFYKREHGKQPRGVGKWAFMLLINDFALTRENYPYEHYKEGRFTIVWTSGIMSLTDAKNEIKAWLLEHGFKNDLVYIAD